jgi:hypothetical protein
MFKIKVLIKMSKIMELRRGPFRKKVKIAHKKGNEKNDEIFR